MNDYHPRTDGSHYPVIRDQVVKDRCRVSLRCSIKTAV